MHVDRAGLLAAIDQSFHAPAARREGRGSRPWALDLTYVQTQGLSLLAGVRAAVPASLLIGLAVLGFLVVAVGMAGRSGPPEALAVEAKGADPTLVARGLVGDPRLVGEGGEEPLTIGRPIKAGQRVSTGPGQKVALESSTHLFVNVLPESEVAISAVPHPGAGPSELALELISGTVVIDARHATGSPRIKVLTEAAQLDGSQMTVRAQQIAGGLTVFVAEGTGTLTSRHGGAKVDVEKGQMSSASSEGGPAPPKPFAPGDIAWR
jgi:hypothetical protein